MPYIEVNTIFGRLTTLKNAEKRFENNGNSFWWRQCLCECGKTVWIREWALMRKNGTQSCGCLASEVHAKRMKNEARGFAINRKWRPLLPNGVSAVKRLFKVYKRQAKNRSYCFDIDLDFFLQITKEECHYCGTEPCQSTNYPNVNGQYVYNGIDRIRNEEGYIKENCVPCCGICNQMKMALGYEEFLRYIKLIYNRLVKDARIY
jgi:hypothetical protein